MCNESNEKMAPGFKVGDRVRVVQHRADLCLGALHTVANVGGSPGRHGIYEGQLVELEGEEGAWMSWRFEKVEEEQTSDTATLEVHQETKTTLAVLRSRIVPGMFGIAVGVHPSEGVCFDYTADGSPLGLHFMFAAPVAEAREFFQACLAICDTVEKRQG